MPGAELFPDPLAWPIDPPPTSWQFRVPRRNDDDLVGVGADLEPGTLLSAYRHGLFPMPMADSEAPYWFSPVQRALLPLDGLRVTRSMRRSARSFEIRVNTAFAEVIDGCADPRRPHGWIDGRIRHAYLRLHRLGWAHSVEAWRDGALAGGLYGVAIGGLFAGESMFHRVRDASKVALMALVALLNDEYADARLLDVQWRTDHLASLGVVEMARPEFLARLGPALTLPLPAAFADPPKPPRTLEDDPGLQPG